MGGQEEGEGGQREEAGGAEEAAGGAEAEDERREGEDEGGEGEGNELGAGTRGEAAARRGETGDDAASAGGFFGVGFWVSCDHLNGSEHWLLGHFPAGAREAAGGEEEIRRAAEAVE